MTKPRVIWKPLAGSQALALTAPCDHILYEGTRGPGKTDCQLMRFRMRVGQGYGAYWRGIIFDRQYKSLDDLVAKSKKWFPQFGDGARFLSGQSSYKWVWPTGEELHFRVMEKPSDYDKYHGHEYPFIGWNELCKYPTLDCYDLMMSCNRSSFIPSEHSPDKSKPIPKIPLEVFSTANPHGVGHNAVKRRFITPAPAGKVVRVTTEVFNPQTKKKENYTRTQVRIFGSYRENKYLDPAYIAELENISDPNKRAAWLHGDWDITAGGALDDIWRRDVHILPRFVVPKSWKIVRSFDWGSTHPFSVGWWAISNGESFEDMQGNLRCYPKGTLIRIAELYGAVLVGKERFGHNKGNTWGPARVAKEILDKEESLKLLGWIQTKPRPGPADNQINDVRDKETMTIKKIMNAHGVAWTSSDKSKGTRKMGLELIRSALTNAITKEGAGLYVMDNCEVFIETVPGIPRDEKDPDDVDTTAEDHCYDETRYMLLDDKPSFVSELKVLMPT